MFTIWRNDRTLETLEVLSGLLIFLGLFWLYVNVPDPQITKFTNVYMIMILLSAVMYAGKNAPISGAHLQTVGFGKSYFIAALAGLIGAGIATALLGAVSFNLFPLGVVEILSSQLVLVAVFAAISEEIFFRSSLIPTIAENLGSDVAGIVVGSIAFALFHFSVYGGDTNAMLSAFAFSIAASVGNSIFKSTLFGYSLHITWNYMVVTGGMA